MSRQTILVTPYQIAQWQPQVLKRLTSAGFKLIVNSGERYWNADELASKATSAHCIFASSGCYDASTLAGAAELRLIVKFGVGCDNIDLTYCASRSIVVAAALGTNHHAVADYAMAFILCTATDVIDSRNELKQGTWRTRVHRDVHGATLGILGLGRIGTEVARRARGFDMRILYWDLQRMPEKENAFGLIYSSIEELATEADFVSVNLPRTDRTRNLVDAGFLERMKPTASLVNTARGGIVDELALLTALREGRLLRAASDVFVEEPAIGNPLLELPNFIGTPHTAAVSQGSVRAMAEVCEACAQAYFSGVGVPGRYLVGLS